MSQHLDHSIERKDELQLLEEPNSPASIVDDIKSGPPRRSLRRIHRRRTGTVANPRLSTSPRRPKASVWNHFETIVINGIDGINARKAKCKICQQIVSPKVERLRRHILENHAEVADEETEERFLSSKEAVKTSVGRGDAEQLLLMQKSKKPVTAPSSAVKSLAELTMKKDPDGRKALIWSYFQLLHATGTAQALKVIGAQCKVCDTMVSPKIERLRRHFLNHHTSILIGSDEFDVQRTLDKTSGGTDELQTPSLIIETHNNIKASPDRNEMEWTRKYFDWRDGQAQCRLCLSFYQPHLECLHDHLNISHQGILEFCDSPVQAFKKENEVKDIEIEHIEAAAEFEWECPEQLIVEDARLADLCLMCDSPSAIDRRGFSAFPAWQSGCAQSLCQIFSLDESYGQYFEAGKYCHSCQQLLRNIDFTQRAINRLRNLLKSYRHSYESLLRKKYLTSNYRETKEAEAFGDNIIRKLYRTIFKDKRNKSVCPERRKGFPRPSTKRQGWNKPRKPSSSDEDDEEEKMVTEYKSRYRRACNPSSREHEQPNIEDPCDKGINPEDAVLVEYDDEHFDDEDWVTPDKRRKTKSHILTKQVNVLSRSRRGSKPIKKEKTNSTTDPRIKKEGVMGMTRQKYVCEVSGCTFSSYQKTWLDVHIRSRHEQDALPYHCECGEKFGNMTRYGLHQRKHILESKKRASCTSCQKSFPDKLGLKAHREESHRRPVRVTLPEDQRCSFCAFVISKAELLSEHEKLHELKIVEKLPYDCVLCRSQMFTNTMSLQAHVKSAHNPVANGPKCDHCEKIFKTAKILRRHLKRAHVDESLGPNWKCSECGLVTGNRAEYRAHFKQHAKPRPFLCAECGMTFKSKSNLRIHSMLHTGERPWKCKVCPKGFNQSSKLRAHEETHVEVKTYVCDKCGKAFRTARNIYQHQKFHCHPEGPKAHNTSVIPSKKTGRDVLAQQRVSAHVSDDEESNATLCSIPRPTPDDDNQESQFQQSRHHLGSLPSYSPSAGGSLGESLSIDPRATGTFFLHGSCTRWM